MVYTKKGDGGATGLFGTTKRVSKSSSIIRAIGAVDEANSYLGVVISKSSQPQGLTLKLMRGLRFIGIIPKVNRFLNLEVKKKPKNVIAPIVILNYKRVANVTSAKSATFPLVIYNYFFWLNLCWAD